MNVIKFKDAEQQDAGSLLGTFTMGIRTKCLIHNGDIFNSGHFVSLKHIAIEPRQDYPLHPSESSEISFILSGTAVFQSGGKELELKASDVVYINKGEYYSIKNSGNTSLEMICFCASKK